MSVLSDLVANLQIIDTEVQTKIIPGNIKSGVTIFGVTGTYDGPDDPGPDDPGELE